MSTSMRTFYTILITQTISMLGSTMSAFAVGVWVFQRTGEATPMDGYLSYGYGV